MNKAEKLQFDYEISEEAKENFLKFLEEVKKETTNSAVVNHTNSSHSNHSNW